MRQRHINDTIKKYLCRVKVEHLCELAQYLIALRIEFSTELNNQLVQQKQVAYVVGCYLSKGRDDIVGALKFLLSSNNDEAVKILIHSDLNQLVYLLNEAKESNSEVAKN